MKRLVVATANPGKLREFRAALEAERIEVLGLEALADRTEVPETGATFEANARLKAEGYSRRTDLPLIAEDSGLEVDALDGAPGVRSARFGGPGLDDAGRTRLLLEKLKNVPEHRRTARYRCVIALAHEGRVLATFDGAVEGRIVDEQRGTGGFGYDPVFWHDAVSSTFAEISPEQKQRLSHRGEAIDKLVRAIQEKTVTIPDG